MNNLPILSIITWLPALAALVILWIPPCAVRWIRAVAALSTGIAGLLCIYLYQQMGLQPDSAMHFVENLPWSTSLGIQYKLGVDGLSAPMMLLSGIICFTATLMSFSQTERVKEYFCLALVAMTGVFGVYCSIDLFFFIIFYELASIPMFFLVGIWGSNKLTGGKPIYKDRAAMKLLIYLQLGGAIVLIGIMALYFAGPVHSFDWEILSKGVLNPTYQKVIFLILFIGFGIEAGLVPFHTWLPEGHSSAPTPLSMMLAGVLLKMGGYGIMRVGLPLVPQGSKFWLTVFAAVGTINILYGGLCALRQSDIKAMIAYSSVSHMGMVFMGLGCVNGPAPYNSYGLSGVVFQMFSHGIITALLFGVAGTVYSITHCRDIRGWGGLVAVMPKLGIFYIIGALGSLGLPGMTGFVAEFMVFFGSWGTYWYIVVPSVLGLILTTIYLLRSVQYGFLGPLNPQYLKVRDAAPAELTTFVILTATTMAFGMFPYLLLQVSNPTIHALCQRLAQ